MLLAAVGLPELEGEPVRPEQGLLALRKELGVYANLRPAHAPGIDLLIVRELTGGLYFGAKGTRDDGTWFDTCEYTRPEVERIARRAFELARGRGGRLTSVDKVNVMHTSRLWRDVVSELGAAEYPDVPLDHALVDSFAMTIVDHRRRSTSSSPRTRSATSSPTSPQPSPADSVWRRRRRSETTGLACSSRCTARRPQIAGLGIANPAAMLRSTALLLRHGLERPRRRTPSNAPWTPRCRVADTRPRRLRRRRAELGDEVLRALERSPTL